MATDTDRLQWSPTHSGRETIMVGTELVAALFKLQWSPTHSGRETQHPSIHSHRNSYASMEPYPFR